MTEVIKVNIAEDINGTIKLNPDLDTNLISDGYHTFGELYDHRITLYVALCKNLQHTDDIERACHQTTGKFTPTYGVWRSKKHSDGELAFGGTWFVLGIDKRKGEQITYHLPIERWDETEFAETLEVAPEFDGHTPKDVLERLKGL